MNGENGKSRTSVVLNVVVVKRHRLENVKEMMELFVTDWKKKLKVLIVILKHVVKTTLALMVAVLWTFF